MLPAGKGPTLGFFAKLFSRGPKADAKDEEEEAPPERAFWAWFVENQSQLRAAPLDEFGLPDDDGFLGADLLSQLQECDFGLGCEMRDLPDGRRELILIADGDPELFPVVRRVAAAAPVGDLPDWHVVALRPRPIAPPEDGERYKINGAKFRAGEFRFALRRGAEPGAVGIDLYHRAFADRENPANLSAAQYFLARTLGEQDCASLAPGAVVLHARPSDDSPVAALLRPLRDLPAAFDAATRGAKQ